MRIMRFILIPLLVLILKFQVSCGQVSIQNFTVAEGLPQIQVTSIAEDSLHYLWVGTLGGGLARFDGENFNTYTITNGLPSNFILDLLVLSPTKIWIATQKGVSYFDGTTFKNFDTAQGSGTKMGTGLRTVALFNNGDSIFYKLDNGKAGMILKDSLYTKFEKTQYDNIRKIIKPKKDLTFIVQETNDGPVLLMLDNGFSHSQSIKNIFSILHSVFLYKKKIILSTNKGLFQYSKVGLIQLLEKTFPIFGYDDQQNHFFGFKDFQLISIHAKTGTIQNLQSLKGLVASSYMGSDNILWIGSDKGLYKMYHYPIEKKLTDGDQSDLITAVTTLGNELWVGTSYFGVKIYKDQKLTRVLNFGQPLENFVNFLRKDSHGTIWIGTLGGLAAYKNGICQWVDPSSLPCAAVMDFDKNDRLIVSGGNLGGLYQVNGINEIINFPEYASSLVRAVCYNKASDMFAIATDSGIDIFNGKIVKRLHIPELEDVEMSTLEWLDETTLAIGTYGKGIFIYSFLKNQLLININESIGLISNTLFMVFKDGQEIWVGTEKGINRIRYDQQHNNIIQITDFDLADGLFGLETNLNAYYKQDSTLLFGAIDGLYQYKKNHAESLTGKIHINGVKVFYNREPNPPTPPVTSSNYTSHRYLFKNSENHLTFSFNKVDKRKPKSLYYTYKLEGHDTLQSIPSEVKSVTYSNLKPGDYTFSVMATDKSGSFIKDQTSFRFRIIPAFYQTVYFKSGIGIFIVIVVFLFIYYYNRIKVNRALYIQKIKAEESARLRKEIARDFHDELGNQVARMINFTGLLKICGNIASDNYLTLNEYLQRILNGAKDFVWTLDPSNDELDKVMLHLKDFGERMFSEKQIDFRFYGDIENSIKIPMGYSRQISLIFKEAMTNTFKHSHATAVDFTLQVNDTEIIISLKDNGIGIRQEDWRNSQGGLSNMKMRAARINSKIDLFSAEHCTDIQLTLILK